MSVARYSGNRATLGDTQWCASAPLGYDVIVAASS